MGKDVLADRGKNKPTYVTRTTRIEATPDAKY